MGRREIETFLTDLATRQCVSASTQNQALAAILFLYRDVLRVELPWLDDVVRAKRSVRIPVVLSRAEVRALLDEIDGVPYLMASLLYGSGLRLLECARLRVKDIDFARGELIIRDGKGKRDRRTMLPSRLIEPLADQLLCAKRQHDEDIERGGGHVVLPGAFARKAPSASREWVWQWVFPATRTYVVPSLGLRRRHHLHETVVQRAVKRGLGVPT